MTPSPDSREARARALLIAEIAKDSGHDAEYMRRLTANHIMIRSQTALRALSRCDCNGIDMGGYEAQVELVPPAHMPRDDGRGICIDACLALEISDLWKRGISTTGCCCGHNAAPPYIGVIDADISRMKALGYVVHPNSVRPGEQDSFTPKSLATAEQQRTVPEEGVLRDLVQEMLDNLKHCSLESGCCHCGDNMSNHAEPMSAGHSPVDMGWTAAQNWIEKANAALAQSPAPDATMLEKVAREIAIHLARRPWVSMPTDYDRRALMKSHGWCPPVTDDELTQDDCYRVATAILAALSQPQPIDASAAAKRAYEYYQASTCPCMAAEQYVPTCPKHGHTTA